MVLSNDKFSEGMNTSQYVDSIKVNKQPFLDIYSATQVPEIVQDFFDTPVKRSTSLFSLQIGVGTP